MSPPSLIARSRLLMPLVYLVGVVVVLEEAFWRAGLCIGGWIARLPLARLFEKLILALPPWAALCAFVLPGVLLIPVKLLALIAIANGHAATGVTTFVVAKLAGAAVPARRGRRQPVPHELLVEAGLRTARLPRVRRPEA